MKEKKTTRTMSNNKRKTILPLHIDTTSFTSQTQNNGYIWRRLNKRQVPIFILLTILFSSLLLNVIQHSHKSSVPIFNSYDSLPPLPLIEKYHAIIVAGHAIYTGPDNLQETKLDSNWILEPFQQGGQIHVFIEHIQKSIDLLKQDDNAVLIFSG